MVVARPVCVLTDFGLDDEWVGLMHRALRSAAPGVEIVDLTHRIARQDVRAGALALWRAVPWLAPAVVLGVVDPGVATARRAVAIEVETERGRLTLVGPDNGLLTPAAYRAGQITAAVELDDRRWHGPAGPGVGTTFAGRDVFAPVAGHLAAGVATAAVGREIEVAGLAGGPLEPVRPRRRVAGGAAGAAGAVGAGPAGTGPEVWSVEATVWWVDTFGNAQLNVAAADLPRGGTAVVRAGAGAHKAVLAAAYADLGGRLGLVPDSAGLVALCLDRRSAAAHLGLGAGDTVTVEIAEIAESAET